MAQWEVHFNGTKLKKISSIKIKEELTEPLSIFSCIMRNPNDAERTSLAAKGHVLSKHRLEVYRKGVKKFDGFLEAANPNGLDMVLEGRSFEVLLLDERTGQDVEYIGKTGAYILDDATFGIKPLYSTKVTLSDITYTETITGTLRYNHDNLLKSIAKVSNIHQKDFWVTYTGAAFKLWVGTRGSGSVGSPTGTFYAGKDVVVTVEKQNIRDIINRIRVFGSGDGINQIKCCVPFIDVDIPESDRVTGFDGVAGSLDCTHTVASASQSESTGVGIMEGKPHIDRSIVSLSHAVEIAKTILDENAQVYKNLSVDFAKYKDLTVGDWIRIIDVKKGLDVTTRVEGLTHNYNINGTDKLDVILYNPFKTTERRINVKERDSDTTNTSGQGATNIFQVASYENCDAGHPLNLRFRLPDDIVQVNKVLCSFKLKDYRAYHTGLAADAAHTHTLAQKVYDESLKTGTPDIYLVGELFFNVIDGYKFGSDDATRTLLAETSSAGTSHNHAVTYAIHEVALTSPSVVVTAGIDGAETAVDTYTTDQNEIDITSNIGATGNWMNVEFTPNKPMRIECNIYVKCYIESK